MKWNLRTLVSVLLLMSVASQTKADIFEWAWVNPGDPTQGVYQSSVVCPGGSGVSAVPGVNLSYLDLTQAYLLGTNLTSSYLDETTLTNANLSNANLTSSNLYETTLTAQPDQCQPELRRPLRHHSDKHESDGRDRDWGLFFLRV